MAYLYYTELGNVAGGPLSNTGPFRNLQAFRYWSGTEYVTDPTGAWTFNFSDGGQFLHHKDAQIYALAVRAGVRSTVKEVPATWNIGLIIFTVLAGLGAVYFLRKQGTTES